jgi:hypothetical protein
MRNFAVASFRRKSKAEEVKSAVCKDDSEDAADQREESALSEQLAHDAATASAERGTQGDFTLARCGAC